ncbi:putative ABC transporter [Xylanimonas cellulosilytica DSM 15894]|uniref:ABC transporter n=1 Tax=Xylanimonas cellulosilytica (strain DSM 15894 / JCM 12276 / CECT 5975 / KCTC 9989 / LMG 20990 / NBRC 107835 / XIL07) TaxID=446471 RepID=D1BZG4_XYLCX|nr:GTP-binding protein [Xylanimonas cellulosilytica]ACZ30118.1 putative ABC transporter [Xylanimonas cellulosilytica DSM 15894]
MTDDATLRTRTDDLAEALAIAGDRLDAVTAARVQQAVDGVRERLALGVDHTVVALAGGTGSGKSSLFNKIARLTFADVGIKRPTTARVTACSWDDGAEALLDWIGVDRERRIVQAGELEMDDALDGLVLLDLPDHDSVEPKHREVVDRILPLVDLLIWVVDPQKYADDALHSGYLRESVGMEASMLVLLNQIDTVPPGRRDELLADLDRLLVDDGLQGVPVVAVSARSGEGVAQVHELLSEVCERQTVAAGRAAGELDAAARLLLAHVPAEVPWELEQAVARELPALVAATGLDAVAGQVGAAVSNGYGMPEFPPPDRDAVTLSRARWLTRAGASLPAGWQRSLAESAQSADVLRTGVYEAVRSIRLDVSGPRRARTLRRLAWGLGVAAAVVGTFAGFVLGGTPDLSAPWPVVLWCVTGVLLVAALAVGLGVAVARRRLARRRAEGVAREGRAALEKVLADGLGLPTQKLLAEQRRVRRLAQSARDLPVAARAANDGSLPPGAAEPPSSTGALPRAAESTARG